jgi:hypothetical protein
MTEKATDKKLNHITQADIGTLSTSLINKSYVHELPTILLIRAHNRVELEHLLDPKNRRLQIAHTNLFKEMELREIDHFDTDPNFFTPSNIKWPFEWEGEDFTIEVFEKQETKRAINKPAKAKKVRFKKTAIARPKKPRTLRFRRKKFKEDVPPKKKTVREKIDRANLIERHSTAINWASLLVGDDETKRIFKEKAVATWNIQPNSGNIPIGIGPRPKKEHWYKTLFPPMGAYQAFMQLTLSAFYRRQTPTWAIQEWDIELTVTIDGEDFTTEKRNFISVKIDPN